MNSEDVEAIGGHAVDLDRVQLAQPEVVTGRLLFLPKRLELSVTQDQAEGHPILFRVSVNHLTLESLA